MKMRLLVVTEPVSGHDHWLWNRTAWVLLIVSIKHLTQLPPIPAPSLTEWYDLRQVT